MELHATVFIGAFLITRGLGFFFGGFPNEAQTIADLRAGKNVFTWALVGYIALFLVLNVVGTMFQHARGYGESMPSKAKKNINNGDFENQNLVQASHGSGSHHNPHHMN